jgi:hypothetical protein
MAEWRNGGRNGGMAERMAEWSNGGNGYIRTFYGTHRRHRRRHLLIFYSIDSHHNGALNYNEYTISLV